MISALETLESLANHNEKENEEILMLKKTVESLENEKQVKQQDRIKFEMVNFSRSLDSQIHFIFFFIFLVETGSVIFLN